MLVALLALCAPALAGSWEAGFRAGIHTGGVRDDLLVELGYGGVGVRLGGTADVEAGPGDLSADLQIGMRALWNRFGHLGLSLDHQLDVAYTVRLGSGAWTPGVGLAAAWDARMNLFDRWDDAHGYWMGAQWIGPAGHLRGPIGASTLDLGLAVAVVGGTGRPPEYRWYKQDPTANVPFLLGGPTKGEQFTAIDTLQAARLEATVILPGEGRGRWQVGLDSRFVRCTVPEPAVDLAATAWFGRTWGTR